MCDIQELKCRGRDMLRIRGCQPVEMVTSPWVLRDMSGGESRHAWGLAWARPSLYEGMIRACPDMWEACPGTDKEEQEDWCFRCGISLVL